MWDAAVRDDEPLTALYLWALDAPTPDEGPDALARAQTLAVDAPAHIARAMAAHPGPRQALWCVTECAVPAGLGGSVPLATTQAMLWGLGRTLVLEQPELWGGLIDVDDDGRPEPLVDEILAGNDAEQVALRGEARYVARLRPHVPVTARSAGVVPVRLNGEATYLVTGGLGAIGLRMARGGAARA